MTIKRTWLVVLALFFFVGTLTATAAMAQNKIRDGRTVAPNAPKLVLLHAPKRIVPVEDLPIYVSVKAGEADLKEIVWSFENPPYSDISFGAYRIKPGEEKEVTGHFTLSTFDALRTGTISNTEDLVLYIKVWARDVEERISQVGYFEVILDSLAKKDFSPPDSNMSFAKNFGVIEGRIVPTVSDGSERGGN